MKKYRHFGKKWTLEYNGDCVYITDAHSAATVGAWLSLNDFDLCITSFQLWANVPPYIKKIVSRHLLKGKKNVSESKNNRQWSFD